MAKWIEATLAAMIWCWFYFLLKMGQTQAWERYIDRLVKERKDDNE